MLRNARSAATSREDTVQDVTIQDQVDAALISPHGEGPPSQSFADTDLLFAWQQIHPAGGWHADLELHRHPVAGIEHMILEDHSTGTCP